MRLTDGVKPFHLNYLNQFIKRYGRERVKKRNDGYRRMALKLRNRGFFVNHKKVKRLMEILDLSIRIRRKRKYTL